MKKAIIILVIIAVIITAVLLGPGNSLLTRVIPANPSNIPTGEIPQGWNLTTSFRVTEKSGDSLKVTFYDDRGNLIGSRILPADKTGLFWASRTAREIKTWTQVGNRTYVEVGSWKSGERMSATRTITR